MPRWSRVVPRLFHCSCPTLAFVLSFASAQSRSHTPVSWPLTTYDMPLKPHVLLTHPPCFPSDSPILLSLDRDRCGFDPPSSNGRHRDSSCFLHLTPGASWPRKNPPAAAPGSRSSREDPKTRTGHSGQKASGAQKVRATTRHHLVPVFRRLQASGALPVNPRSAGPPCTHCVSLPDRALPLTASAIICPTAWPFPGPHRGVAGLLSPVCPADLARSRVRQEYA